MFNVNSTPTTETTVSSATLVSEARQAQPVKEGNKTEDRTASSKGNKEDVKSAVSDLNNALDSMNVRREFKIEDSTNDVVVKIIDKDEQKVIRQIPSEEALKLSKNIKEMVGLLYDSTS